MSTKSQSKPATQEATSKKPVVAVKLQLVSVKPVASDSGKAVTKKPPASLKKPEKVSTETQETPETGGKRFMRNTSKELAQWRESKLVPGHSMAELIIEAAELAQGDKGWFTFAELLPAIDQVLRLYRVYTKCVWRKTFTTASGKTAHYATPGSYYGNVNFPGLCLAGFFVKWEQPVRKRPPASVGASSVNSSHKRRTA